MERAELVEVIIKRIQAADFNVWDHGSVLDSLPTCHVNDLRTLAEWIVDGLPAARMVPHTEEVDN